MRRCLTLVDGHLRDATDRTSELLAALIIERDTISRDALLDAMRMHGEAILAHLWEARWQMPLVPSEDGGAQ